MDDEQFKQISDKLDILIKLLASNSLGNKTQKESIEFLSNFNLTTSKIAEILGTTPNTVSVTKSKLKKQK